MVDEAGQDPIEIEPAADVVRDPSQGFYPMQLVRDLVGLARDRHDGPDPLGEDPGDVGVALGE